MRSCPSFGSTCVGLESINMPEHDRFQVITDHPAEGLLYDPSYLGITRTDDLCSSKSR